MKAIQARLLLSKLDRVEMDTATRIRYAGIYHEGLSGLNELILPPFKIDGSHIYTYYPIQYKDRLKLVKWLIKHYCDLGVQHLKNCADLPAFKDYYQDCPNARATANEVILLPTYPRYPEKEIKRNVRLIRQFFDEKGQADRAG